MNFGSGHWATMAYFITPFISQLALVSIVDAGLPRHHMPVMVGVVGGNASFSFGKVSPTSLGAGEKPFPRGAAGPNSPSARYHLENRDFL
jgi:hypothetical protein